MYKRGGSAEKKRGGGGWVGKRERVDRRFPTMERKDEGAQQRARNGWKSVCRRHGGRRMAAGTRAAGEG